MSLKRIFEEELKSSWFKPQTEIPPPKLRYNPKLKRSVARAKLKILPPRLKEEQGIGKILPPEFLERPTIETSPLFRSLPAKEQEKILRHEIQHIIMAGAGGIRQSHHKGSLFGLSLEMRKLPRYYEEKKS
jgi:hypothetical protein